MDMSVQPLDDYDPDDLVEILHVLSNRFHDCFLAEFGAAVEGARQVERYRQLHDLLRLWRLRAVAYSDPGSSPGCRLSVTGGSTISRRPTR